MDALINLQDCKEFMTITLNGQDHKIKLSGTITDPHFCGKDVCKVLGYKNTNDAISRHVKIKNKKSLKEILEGVDQYDPFALGKKHYETYNEASSIYINEPGLYSLIMHSNAVFAETFQDLVYETILPSIRKYGSYKVESQLSSAMELLAIKDKSEQELKLRAERAEKADLKPNDTRNKLDAR